MKKTAKILIGFLLGLIALMAIVIIFISPIAKYLIQKYDVKYLGREITLDWIYINPFTGYIHIQNLKVYEAGGMNTEFFSATGVSADFAMLKMLTKTYEIESITLTKPRGWIRQDHQSLNFNDLIIRFTPKDTVKKEGKPPVHFNILDIKIVDGEFHYEEQSIPVSYYIKNVNISSDGKRWDVDSMLAKVSVQSGPASGSIKGIFNINLKNLDYNFSAQINKYDLKFIEQYLRDFANYGSFTANLDGDIRAKGNFKVKLALETKGILALNDFHFGKVPGEDYLSFDKLALNMLDVDPGKYSYYFDTIRIDKPLFKYERYDGFDNITALFGKNMQNIKSVNADSTKFNLVIEIGKYINDLVKNFLKSYYKINRVAIYKGNVRFNDFSLREQFSVAADPFTLIADSIDKNHKRMNIRFATGINPYGDINVAMSIDPNNYGTFDVDYNIVQIPVSLFNPYLLSYTSFPLDRGALGFHGYLNVSDSNINSDNHLLITDPRVGKRLKAKDTKWIPVPLIMSIVRSPGGVIDYDIPIRGSLKDPKFKFRYVIMSIIGNIFIKPPTTPYLFHVKEVENKVEKFLTLKWETRKTSLHKGQQRFVEMMAKYLKDSPDGSIVVSPMEYTQKEKEYILFFEAKKKYRLRNSHTKAMSEDDSITIDKMSIKDSAFVGFLNKLAGDTAMFTIQEKCKYYLGDSTVNAEFTRLRTKRLNSFMALFPQSVAGKIKISTGQTIIPFNGFSYYKIGYNGEIPEKLQNAYDEINNIEDESPRKRYEKARKENGGVLKEARVPVLK